MFFVGIDISKYKHDCFIISDDGEITCNDLTIQNSRDGFNQLLSILNSLNRSEGIRIGFYHMYSLKSLTRLRDSLVRQRSFYLVKITNVLDHVFPEFKPFFKNRFGKTALFILNKYGSVSKIASMNSRSYDDLRRTSRGKFSMSQFLELRTLAKNTVGVSNYIFELELSSLLSLYQNLCVQIDILESEICTLVNESDHPIQSIPGIGPLSAAVILSEFGDISRFKSAASMLSFAGLEPAYYQSGTPEYTGHMVKRASSHLRYT